MLNKYFWVLTCVIIVLLLSWKLCFKINEPFQSSWIDTIKCLNLNYKETEKLLSFLDNSKDKNEIFNKLYKMLRDKGLPDNKIFECMFGIHT